MAYQNIKCKKVNLNQFRLYEGDFPDKLWSARYQFQNMFDIDTDADEYAYSNMRFDMIIGICHLNSSNKHIKIMLNIRTYI